MAFENKRFSVLTYANGFTHWHYNTSENIEEIIKDGYFDPIYTLINNGDLITISAKNTSDIYYVANINPTKLKKLGEKL